jgi:hypothetical protein
MSVVVITADSALAAARQRAARAAARCSIVGRLA